MLVLSARLMAAFLAAATVARGEVSPDGSCGLSGAGEEKGYTCPGDVQCCGATGWCGTSEAHCLTTVGCQADYSNSTAAWTEPVPGTTISPDGICGVEGAGVLNATSVDRPWTKIVSHTSTK